MLQVQCTVSGCGGFLFFGGFLCVCGGGGAGLVGWWVRIWVYLTVFYKIYEGQWVLRHCLLKGLTSQPVMPTCRWRPSDPARFARQLEPVVPNHNQHGFPLIMVLVALLNCQIAILMRWTYHNPRFHVIVVLMALVNCQIAFFSNVPNIVPSHCFFGVGKLELLSPFFGSSLFQSCGWQIVSTDFAALN